MVPKPFVKWAGGKTKMIPFILSSFPESVKTYYEPFVGGGAVFFEMLRLKRFKKAVLSDSNPDLMNAFATIQEHVDSLVTELKKPRYKYEKKTYYRIRGEETDTMASVERAARFIYLNRTCFNGLHRVNKSGGFNTPFGKYVDPLICDEDNLRAVSKALKGVTLRCEDFTTVVEKAKEGDAVYFDPPYLPISETSSFTAYGIDGFAEEDHWRLKGLFRKLHLRGVSVVLSNSLCDLTKEMYSGFDIRELTGARNIGGPAEYRKAVKEIMVVGGPAKTGEKVA